ncbi:hypothetical protein ACFO1B_30595 [Dactylosporangium siamense]|uniref:Uncharacterized protein n=1 Tax=Dactylosporangium siamense TaxID=685454 RepID=A0A919PTG7_9ACTN|nr:hypothetical protein [Dactylosporangium siamense]GIG48173.1 hypothetical protein Dsi01nite_062140 [Dactylosporangium siamense]
MEPGHPPRQDPPTEPGHDQVNGSPPRPGSRRGWMSDSPLDGGSGWPTSAYAIVPRQATPQPQQAPQNPPAQNPVADAAQYTTQPIRHETFDDADAVPAVAPHRRRRIAALVIGLIVLLVAVVGGVLATRGSGGGADQPDGERRAVTGPAVAGTTAAATSGTTATAGASGGPSLDPSGSPVPGLSGTPDPSAVVTSPVPAGTVTDVLRAGTVRLAVLAGQPDEAFDFDGGVKQAAGADIAAGALGLTAVGGAAFAPVLSAPTLAACSAVPAAQWTDKVLLAALLPTAKVCLRTGEQRFGWFSPRSGDAVVSGQIYTTYLDFTVWKKAGD